ncbi:MAG: chorismate lyase [Porticoccaceae bacterium]|nr:chorismate lyase [Porticoccaceae bacterium]
MRSPLHSVHWYPADRWLQNSLAPQWRNWLADQGSLTKRLVAASSGCFSVRIIRQGYGRPSRNEARALGLPLRQQALIRETVLSGNNAPWVYARSIVPLATLSGRLRALANLDNRPLGALLFADKTLRRGAIDIARIPGRAIPEHLAKDASWLWGRRSLFYLDNKPLLVSEIFLPDFNQEVAPVA